MLDFFFTVVLFISNKSFLVAKTTRVIHVLHNCLVKLSDLLFLYSLNKEVVESSLVYSETLPVSLPVLSGRRARSGLAAAPNDGGKLISIDKFCL